MSDKAEGAMHFGKDCPKGKVQIEFVGCPPDKRHGAYGWEPVDSAFLEVYVDGRRFRIDVGDFAARDGSTRRGLHIIGDCSMVVDKHSINAMDVYLPSPPAPEVNP